MVLGRGAVAAQLGATLTPSASSRWGTSTQRVGDDARRGAGQPGLDEHDVGRRSAPRGASPRRRAGRVRRRARSRRGPRSRRAPRRAPARARPRWRPPRAVRRGRPGAGRTTRRWSARRPARSASPSPATAAPQHLVDLVRRAGRVDHDRRGGCRAAPRRPGPGGCGPTATASNEPPPPTSTPPTSWWPKPSLTCSKARSTRNEPNVCTTGRIPVSASPRRR